MTLSINTPITKAIIPIICKKLISHRTFQPLWGFLFAKLATYITADTPCIVITMP